MTGTSPVSSRNVVAGALVAAAVAVALVAVGPEPHSAPGMGTMPSPNVSGPTAGSSAGVIGPADRLPAPGAETSLPRQASALPDEILVNRLSTPRLSMDPLSRVHALVEVRDGDELTGRIYAIGGGGQVRQLDAVILEQAVDRSGNARSAFGSTVLRGDGLVAAFPQRDRVAVVDLTGSKVRWVPLPGFNERVVWRGAELIVAQATAAYRVDVTSGQVSPTTENGFDVAAADRPGLAVELPGGKQPPVLQIHTGQETVQRQVQGIPGTTRWAHPAWATEDRLAVKTISTKSPQEQGIAAVRLDSGAALRWLPAPGGCCAVAGWLDRQVLLYAAATGWLLAWDVDSGLLSRVARFRSATGGTVSVSLANLAT